MIDYPSQEQLVELIQKEEGRCASILMRTHQSGRETIQNPIRFKNLINEAIEQCGEGDKGLRERLQSLQPLEHDFDFWQNQDAGFALYVTAKFDQRFKLGHQIAEAAVLDDRFFIRPIAAHACRRSGAYALAISWQQARMFESDGHEISELTGQGFPATFNELVTERDAEEQLQFSSHRADGGQNVAMYHGHGEGEGKIEADRNLYLSRIGELVAKVVYNTDQPLLVVATDEVAGHFASATEDVEVTDVVSVSPDGIDDSDLQDRIRVAAHDVVKRSGAKFGEKLGTALANNAGSTQIEEIVAAATTGRVAALLLGDTEPIRGTFDREKQSVQTCDDGTDLANLAVRETLLAGGSVFQFPSESDAKPIAAIYRF